MRAEGVVECRSLRFERSLVRGWRWMTFMADDGYERIHEQRTNAQDAVYRMRAHVMVSGRAARQSLKRAVERYAED